MASNLRQRLVELGLTDSQIEDLEEHDTAKSRLTIFAPIGGTVIEKLAVEGKYVEAGEPIYRIADLSTVWLMLELYPEDAARIRYGQRVTAEMQSLPGMAFDGRVAFIAPQVDTKKRTVGVRVEFLNKEGKLRPGDYANATIYLPIGQEGQVFDAGLAGRWISPMHPQIIRDAPGPCPICGMDLVPTSKYGYSDTPVEQPTSLYVPRSAVLMAGHNSVVYVEVQPGRFEIRPIVLGPILKDKVIVLGGIREGEQVATAGNFLIDSQMQLAGKPSLIDPTKAVVREQVSTSGGEPIKHEGIHIAQIAGETGDNIESLFAAYFRIQQSLASDEKPIEADTQDLHLLSTELSSDPSLPKSSIVYLKQIAQHSEHLHHLDIGKARLEAFRPISHAIVTLATLVRGESATTTFHHMFCHMVRGGGGDWLQVSEQPLNPYWGSEMLTCGREVGELPARAKKDVE
ncbi:MAG: efflux RND transporter periplasmic adaptor subunit [Planctomycetaceae bacterium]|nr:efflux RND transporter periplasmic adaptor subunit [Planctomycetales bacterium]MCB9926925.1 efflux RND transporter periplasmic adaptor subunit [Planctomycetaceae bacterium]